MTRAPRLLAAVLAVSVVLVAPAPGAAATTVVGLTRSCSTPLTYNIRVSPNASSALVRAVGMGVKLTVARAPVGGGAWGPFRCASPTSGTTWYRVYAVGSTPLTGYIYAGAMTFPTSVAALTRSCSTTTSYNIRSSPDAGASLVRTVGMAARLTVGLTPVTGGSWGPFDCASPGSGNTWYRVYAVGSTSLNGYVYAGGVIAPAPPTYSRNLYDAAGVRYQDPDRTACTATATMLMLNFTATKGTPGRGFVWTPSVDYALQESILAWERQHMTQLTSSVGADAHGWRNALNRYGWSSFTDPTSMTYTDQAFATYSAAVVATVRAIAKYRKPVGILGWAGFHSQVVNGYEVYGGDPATSSGFTVVALYLTDPLQKDGLRNARITYADLAAGSTIYRFRPYAYTDSPYDDPYTPGTTPSYTEWYGKWVIVAPVR